MQRILFVSTAVGPLGSGLGGGVELTLTNMALALNQRGYWVTTIAPTGSSLPDLDLIEIPGALQTTAQSQGRNEPITLPANSVLANLWDYVREHHRKFDLILNFGYDWLPFYLTPFIQTPIGHLVSMGSLSDAMDQAIEQVSQSHPQSLAVHSRSQADTFTFGDRCRILGNGFDLDRYQPCYEPDNHLGWVGRIAPEKGLEDAVIAAEATGIPLKIWGAMQHPDYWAEIQSRHPKAPIAYAGFLDTDQLQQQLSRCRALIMTPKWIEAFGNVAIEALACAVPVISYERGGPAEIVQSGKTGWLVKPDDVDGLVRAIGQIDKLDRRACRQQAEAEYSLTAIGDRLEEWFDAITMDR
jgi:UDP-glucose:tetrahydrobiopterin glucosyltransferase